MKNLKKNIQGQLIKFFTIFKLKNLKNKCINYDKFIETVLKSTKKCSKKSAHYFPIKTTQKCSDRVKKFAREHC